MDKRHTQRRFALFALGCLLFNYPILYVFEDTPLVAGIPGVFVYVFAAWGGLLGLAAWVERH